MKAPKSIWVEVDLTGCPEGDDMEKVAEEIRDYLMSPKPENIDTSEERVRESDISEAEPVAWRSYNPVHSTIQDELEEKNR